MLFYSGFFCVNIEWPSVIVYYRFCHHLIKTAEKTGFNYRHRTVCDICSGVGINSKRVSFKLAPLKFASHKSLPDMLQYFIITCKYEMEKIKYTRCKVLFEKVKWYFT